MVVRIFCGDVREQLRLLPDKSVQMVCTSPPYFGLRNYGTDPQVWGGDDSHAHDWDTVPSPGSRSSDTKPGPLQRAGNKGRERLLSDVCACGAWRGELGLEPTPALFIEHLLTIFDEIGRVLRDDGVCFVNLADSYANDAKWGGSSGGKHVDALHGKTGIGRQKRETGVRAKSLFLIPERFAIGMADRGWIVRSQIVWAKKSAMPESVRDRCTSAWEPIFMFVKQPRYYWDADAVRQPNETPASEREAMVPHDRRPNNGASSGAGLGRYRMGSISNGANLRNVWHLGPESFSGEHYASFPTAIPKTCILAATSEKGQCPACGAPWRRVVERIGLTGEAKIHAHDRPAADARGVSPTSLLRTNGRTHVERKDHGWEPGCTCDAGEPIAQVVLDPFGGSGTTGVVADRLGRDAILIELSPAYAAMCERRVRADAGMFAQVTLEASA